jgi:hypothetical protein
MRDPAGPSASTPVATDERVHIMTTLHRIHSTVILLSLFPLSVSAAGIMFTEKPPGSLISKDYQTF